MKICGFIFSYVSASLICLQSLQLNIWMVFAAINDAPSLGKMYYETTTIRFTSNVTQNDEAYLALIRAVAWNTLALQKISCANQNTTNVGFFLGNIMIVDKDNSILLNPSVFIDSGAKCLMVSQHIIDFDLRSFIAHGNDNIGCPVNLTRTVSDGLSGGGLTGEVYYQCILQQGGKDFNTLIAASRNSPSTGGTYRELVLKINHDIIALGLLVNTNDTSQNCIKLITALSSDLKRILASVGNNGVADCSTWWNSWW